VTNSWSVAMNLSAKIAQVWYSFRDRLRLDAKFYAWTAIVFLGISSFASVAQAQLPDLGQCSDLYQKHEDLIANAPSDAAPFVKRFRAASEDKDVAANLLNNPDTLRLAIKTIDSVATNNEELFRQYQQGTINIVYTDQSMRTVARDPVAFLQFLRADFDIWGSFLKCRLNSLQSAANAGTDCEAALRYVQDPNGLQKDLDTAVKQQRTHEEGLDLQQNLKDNLSSDSWWETSPVPVVAAQIKVVTDEIQDFVSIWNPEEAKLSQAKDALLKGLKVAASMIKAAYDNRESVTAAVKAAKDAEAKELADIAAEEIADAIKIGPAYGTFKALTDEQEYVKTLNEAAEARDVVQGQLEKLDNQISQIRSQISIDEQKQTVLEALRADVMSACVQKPIDVTPP
jgi:hypothetical protein